MHDPPGLFLGDGIDAPPLHGRELLQGADRQRDIQRQRHPRGQQAVTAEKRHEPRCPGRHKGPAAPGVVVNKQCAQVTLGLPQHRGEHPMV